MDARLPPVIKPKRSRRAQMWALETAELIAKRLRDGEELPLFLNDIPIKAGEAIRRIQEIHMARLEIWNEVPLSQQSYYNWAVTKQDSGEFSDEDGPLYWLIVDHPTGKAKRTAPSTLKWMEGLRLAQEKREAAKAAAKAADPEANPSEEEKEGKKDDKGDIDDVLKKHGYY